MLCSFCTLHIFINVVFRYARNGEQSRTVISSFLEVSGRGRGRGRGGRPFGGPGRARVPASKFSDNTKTDGVSESRDTKNRSTPSNTVAENSLPPDSAWSKPLSAATGTSKQTTNESTSWTSPVPTTSTVTSKATDSAWSKSEASATRKKTVGDGGWNLEKSPAASASTAVASRSSAQPVSKSVASKSVPVAAPKATTWAQIAK
jgi:hypothetical protein